MKYLKASFLCLQTVSALTGLVWSMASYADPTIVNRYEFEGRVRCVDGKQNATPKMQLSIPQSNGTQFFSPPSEHQVDHWSFHWVIQNPCMNPPVAMVTVDVRNITVDHFLVTGTASGGRDGPTAIHAVISGSGGVLALPVDGSKFIVTRTLVRSYTAQSADAATDAANHDGTVVQ